MRIHVDREDWNRALQRVSGYTDRGATPSTVHLTAASGRVVIATATATGEREHHATLSCETVSHGEVAVSGSMLRSMQLRAGGSVEVRTDGNRLRIAAGRESLAVQTVEAGIPWPLPVLPDDTIAVEATALRDAFGAVAHGIATDEARYGLNGVLVERAGDDDLRLVATDGHRLAVALLHVSGRVDIPPRALIPRAAVADLRHLSGKVQLGYGSGCIIAETPDGRYRWSLIDGEFPDYRHVIPNSQPRTTITVATADLLAAMQACVTASDGSERPAVFTLTNGGVSVSLQRDDRAYTCDLAADCDGERTVVGIRPVYLAEQIKALGKVDRIRLETTHELAPVVVLADGLPREEAPAWGIVMPMRVD